MYSFSPVIYALCRFNHILLSVLTFAQNFRIQRRSTSVLSSVYTLLVLSFSFFSKLWCVSRFLFRRSQSLMFWCAMPIYCRYVTVDLFGLFVIEIGEDIGGQSHWIHWRLVTIWTKSFSCERRAWSFPCRCIILGFAVFCINSYLLLD